MISRRTLLARTLAAAAVAQMPGLTFARGSGEPRLVFVILRGALDGLCAVPPYGDPDYGNIRDDLAIPAPDNSGGALLLDGLFGLHPALAFMKERFDAGELLVFHAVSSPYRERSHFDGQNLLENGTPKPYGSDDGWLNRALAALPEGQGGGYAAVALGQNVPLVLRGAAPVTSWAPSTMPEADADFVERLAEIYAADATLSARLREATEVGALADSNGMGSMDGSMSRSNQRRLQLMAETAGRFLAVADGPRVAVLESSGWDTHVREGGVTGQLATRLAGLDAVLSALAANLESAWRQTAVLVVTEFGRMVAINGSLGTDHGTGTCAFLLGGAVNGGRVIADWPGLKANVRYQGRDLNPTLDLRSVFKGVLHEHLRVGDAQLDDRVFPDSAGARRLEELVRA